MKYILSKDMVTFAQSEQGAITVEKMVVVAGVIGLAIAVITAVTRNTEVIGIRAENALAGEEVASGNFNEVLDGMARASWGWWTDTDYAGWTGLGHPRIELVEQGHRGFEGTLTSGMAVDIESTRDSRGRGYGIEQTFDKLVPGQTYTLSFDAADTRGDNSMQVIFGGEIIGTVDPSGKSFEKSDFSVLAGSGDGSNTLQFVSTGPIDGVGVYVDNVSLR